MRGRKILSVERRDRPGEFGLPGGSVESGESFREAAIRELFEETGLTGHGLLEVFQREDTDEKGVTWECHTFLATTVTGDIHPESGLRVDWLYPSKLCEGTFGLYNRRMLEKLGIPIWASEPDQCKAHWRRGVLNNDSSLSGPCVRRSEHILPHMFTSDDGSGSYDIPRDYAASNEEELT